MKPSEFKIHILLESDHEKIAENYQNLYVAQKRIVSRPLPIPFPNINSTKKAERALRPG